MAPSDLMNRSAAELRQDIKEGRRIKRRIKALVDEYNDCQRAARKQEIHLSRPSHVLTHPTALGWRWESGDWTFIGLSEDELADTPYYVIHLPNMLGVLDMDRAYQSSHRTFIDALDSVQWRLGRGILATPR